MLRDSAATETGEPKNRIARHPPGQIRGGGGEGVTQAVPVIESKKFQKIVLALCNTDVVLCASINGTLCHENYRYRVP